MLEGILPLALISKECGNGLGGLGGQYPGQNKFVPLLKTFVHKLLLKAYIESK